MRSGRLLPVVSLSALVLGCGPVDATPGPCIAGAAVEGDPALHVEPSAGLTVTLEGAVYDDFGALASHDATVVQGADTTRVALLRGDGEGGGRMVLGGDTVEAAPAESLAFPVALLPKGAGGLQVQGADSLTTDIVHDEFGRQQVTAQQFVRAGARWRATFSDYARDGMGRITGFRARIDPAP